MIRGAVALSLVACTHRSGTVTLRPTCPAASAPRPPLRLALASAPNTQPGPALVVLVRDSTSAAPVTAALIVASAADSVRVVADAAGLGAIPSSGARQLRLRIVHIGFYPAVDTVPLRAGFTDTAIVGLRRGDGECTWSPVRERTATATGKETLHP